MPVTNFALLVIALAVVVLAAVWVFQSFGILVFAAALCATGLFARWAMEPVRLQEAEAKVTH